MAATLARFLAVLRGGHGHGLVVLAAALVALGLVSVQGYLGGRMTYDQAVGIESGGQFAQTAVGAQGLRGPALGGGVELADFRDVHGHGLFPSSVVTDRDFQAVNAWLRTLPKRPPGPPG